MPVEWVTFDCYGTLIDWERGITDALLPLLPPETDRRALAEWYIAMEAEFEAEGYHLYKDVLDRVGRRVLHSLDASIPEDKASPLPASLGEWRPFPEVRTALRALVDQGRSIAILSNVDRDLLELSIGRLGIRPDLAITAEDCHSYKPAPGHWAVSSSAAAHPRDGRCTWARASTTTCGRRRRSDSAPSSSTAMARPSKPRPRASCPIWGRCPKS